MQLIGRRTSIFTVLAAAEIILMGAPGASAIAIPAPVPLADAEAAPVPTLAPVLEERSRIAALKNARKRTTTTTPAAAAPTPAAGGWWVPNQNTRWQIQLSDTINTNLANVDAIEVDADTDIATINKIKAQNKKIVAYFSGGSFENWRDDAKSFPASVKGKPLSGWSGEYWLDVRNIAVLKPIMQARAQKAKNKGFDAIDWDNVDGWTQASGFSITKADQLAYNKMLAEITHNLNMSVALKNDLDQIPSLVQYFDFAVNEQCSHYEECNKLLPFLNAGKPVLNIEYPGFDGDSRSWAQIKAQIDSRAWPVVKNMDLDDWGYALRPTPYQSLTSA